MFPASKPNILRPPPYRVCCCCIFSTTRAAPPIRSGSHINAGAEEIWKSPTGPLINANLQRRIRRINTPISMERPKKNAHRSTYIVPRASTPRPFQVVGHLYCFYINFMRISFIPLLCITRPVDQRPCPNSTRTHRVLPPSRWVNTPAGGMAIPPFPAGNCSIPREDHKRRRASCEDELFVLFCIHSLLAKKKQ